jgi:hypothetical protein
MVGVLLADWGFTPQKPVVRSLERNDEAIRKWLEVDYLDSASLGTLTSNSLVIV